MLSVLIVDDVEDNRDLYEEYLRFRGFRVRSASDGPEGVALAREERPDIVLLDLRMPGLSGFETLQLLRQLPTLTGVPVVALTAHALEQQRRDAIRAGFDAFIAKPCLPDDLVREIERILGRSLPTR
jgi:two-component system cell cycle response regulator DivK